VPRVTSVLAACLLIATPAAAQVATAPVQVEGTAGYAGFVDDATRRHAIAGGSLRFRATDRLALGPEVIYMRGPAGDRKLFFTGIAVFDLAADTGTGGTSRPIVPFLVAGGGFTRMQSLVGTGPFTSWEGALTGGGGVRIPVGSKWYVAPDVRIGWEAHLRIGVAIGVR
jgi:hypothetical protein